MACGLYRRTIVRLENDARYVQGQPASLSKLVALYRERRIILDDRRPRRGGHDCRASLCTCSEHASRAEIDPQNGA